MNIFITGGLGILGNSIIKQFSKKNKLIIYDRAKNHKRFLKVKNRNMKFVPGNLTNNKLILKTIRKYKINVIFHLGAQTQVLEALKNPYQTYLINLQSTIKLLEAVRKINNKIIFIYSSSDKAYGEVTKGSYLENYPLNSIYPYDVSKSTSDLIAQSYSKTYGLKVGIIRSANIYGPHDRNLKRIVPETIINLLNKKKIIIRSSGKLKRDYIFVDDVAKAYILTFSKLLKSQKKLLVYNVGSKYNLSVLQLVKKIASLLNIKKNYFKIANTSTKEIKNQRLNYVKIQKELNWKPKVNLDLGLKKTIIWYKKNISEFKI